MRCNDCRAKQPTPKISKRDDICDMCWDRRMCIVTGAIKVTQQELQGIQSAMHGNTEQPASILMDAAAGKVHGDFTI